MCVCVFVFAGATAETDTGEEEEEANNRLIIDNTVHCNALEMESGEGEIGQLRRQTNSSEQA